MNLISTKKTKLFLLRVYFSLFFLFIFFLISCKLEKKPSQPFSIGQTAEILVNTTNDIWKSFVGDTLRKIFSSAQLGLNQPEPLFDLIFVSELDKLLQKYRNILTITINEKAKEPSVTYRKNVFASPQTIVSVEASTLSDIAYAIHKRKNLLIQLFRKTDFERIQRAYKLQENKIIVKKLLHTFDFSLIIPESFFIAKLYEDFCWLRLETKKYSQGILIYAQEYLHSELPTEAFIINWLNEMTKLHVPGQIDGSYMSIDTDMYPIFQNVDFANTKAIEVRGFWRTVGDFMGGPFLLYVFKHPHKNKLIALQGYVFYPNEDKRDLLLQLDAIFHSVYFRS